MNEFNFVIYSHSDYSDILKIQTDYTSNINNKILLINEEFNDSEILSQYSKVINYKDNQQYSDRLLNLNILESEYILFIHDIDVLISYNQEFLTSCLIKMKDENIDRIDLQYYPDNYSKNRIEVSYFNDKIEIVKQENINNYIYNVNPSIWKLSSFMDLMSTFTNRTYRNIEYLDVQVYASKLNIYKLFNDSFLSVGYYNCLDVFIFLHITHGGMLLPKQDNNLTEGIQKIYISIIDKYLQSTDKNFRVSMHG
jgi:hypothetical protein